jgi:hypothetical protein
MAAAALSVVVLGAGTVGAMAAPSSSGMPSSGTSTPPAQTEFDRKIDHTGDRYTDALNLLGADGYTGITNFSVDGPDFTATAVDPNNNRASVVIDPSAGTVKNGG